MWYLVLNKSPKSNDDDILNAAKVAKLLVSVDKYAQLALYAIEEAKRL